jgi:hypothetical protein
MKHIQGADMKDTKEIYTIMQKSKGETNYPLSVYIFGAYLKKQDLIKNYLGVELTS